MLDNLFNFFASIQVDSPVSVIVNSELERICKEEIVPNPRYSVVFVRRNCNVRENLDHDKWSVGQNVELGRLKYEALHVTRL